jgi:hypothetical protein
MFNSFFAALYHRLATKLAKPISFGYPPKVL